MRPSGPGVAVTKPCAGVAAVTELAGRAMPTMTMIRIRKLIKYVVRFFIGGIISARPSRAEPHEPARRGRRKIFTQTRNILLLSVALPNLRQEVGIKELIRIVIRLPIPVGARQRIIHILGPRVDDTLPARIGRERDLRTREGFHGTVTEFTG